MPTSTNDLIRCDSILHNLCVGQRVKRTTVDFLDTWEELAPTPASSASPHCRKCVVRPAKRHLFATRGVVGNDLQNLCLWRREDGDLSPHWERGACCSPSSASTSADLVDFVASCCQTCQTSGPRMWETCCNRGRAICPTGPRCHIMEFLVNSVQSSTT